MLEIAALRRQHHDIMIHATGLMGLGDMIKTGQDATEARAAIDAIDRMLIEHLTIEDDHLYPTLVDCADRGIAEMAEDCFEEMGGILGAWIAYRDRWNVAAIVADPRRFNAATAGVIGALALRIERENSELYPALEAMAERSAKARLAC